VTEIPGAVTGTRARAALVLYCLSAAVSATSAVGFTVLMERVSGVKQHAGWT